MSDCANCSEGPEGQTLLNVDQRGQVLEQLVHLQEQAHRSCTAHGSCIVLPRRADGQEHSNLEDLLLELQNV